VAYVDNFFQFYGSLRDRSAGMRSFDSLCSDVGLQLHERQGPFSFNGLGWDWDLKAMTMVCPEVKRATFMRYLRQWADRPSPLSMSLQEVQMAAGFMQWLSVGFSIGKADVASFICFRTALERIQRSRGGPSSSIRGKAPPQVVASVAFWADSFASWDRTCPIVAGFSPACSFEVLGRNDASTEWGYGGFYLFGDVLLGYARPWTAAERQRAFVTIRESTGVFELMGACHWIATFGGHCTGRRLQLELDSASSVLGLESAYSRRPEALILIQQFRRSCASHRITLRVRHITDPFNSIADHLSHGRIGAAACLALRELGLRLVMVR
jgi:hypothetical protein